MLLLGRARISAVEFAQSLPSDLKPWDARDTRRNGVLWIGFWESHLIDPTRRNERGDRCRILPGDWEGNGTTTVQETRERERERVVHGCLDLDVCSLLVPDPEFLTLPGVSSAESRARLLHPFPRLSSLAHSLRCRLDASSLNSLFSSWNILQNITVAFFVIIW
jgi:hypothetical protein